MATPACTRINLLVNRVISVATFKSIKLLRAASLFSIVLDRLVYRPLRRRNSSVVIYAMASLGIAFSIRAVMLMIWGPDPRRYVQGIHLANHYPFGVVVKTDQIFIFLVALGLAALGIAGGLGLASLFEVYK